MNSSCSNNEDEVELQWKWIEGIFSFDRDLYAELIPWLFKTYQIHHRSQSNDDITEYFIWLESIIEIYLDGSDSSKDDNDNDNHPIKQPWWMDDLFVFIFVMIEISQPIRDIILNPLFKPFLIQLSETLWRPLIRMIICKPIGTTYISTWIANQIRKTYMEYNIRREITSKDTISRTSSSTGINH